jgi:hypothetical protein
MLNKLKTVIPDLEGHMKIDSAPKIVKDSFGISPYYIDIDRSIPCEKSGFIYTDRI